MNESDKIATLNRLARRIGLNATFEVSAELTAFDKSDLVEIVEQVQMFEDNPDSTEQTVTFGFRKHRIIAKVEYTGPADSVETHRVVRIMTDKD